MPTCTETHVLTTRAQRYGKQLVSHLGRKNGGTWDEVTARGSIVLKDAVAHVSSSGEGLRIEIEGNLDDAPRLEDVVGRHLVRFATRDLLVVVWKRADGYTGSVQVSEPSEKGDE